MRSKAGLVDRGFGSILHWHPSSDLFLERPLGDPVPRRNAVENAWVGGSPPRAFPEVLSWVLSVVSSTVISEVLQEVSMRIIPGVPILGNFRRSLYNLLYKHVWTIPWMNFRSINQCNFLRNHKKTLCRNSWKNFWRNFRRKILNESWTLSRMSEKIIGNTFLWIIGRIS